MTTDPRLRPLYRDWAAANLLGEDGRPITYDRARKLARAAGAQIVEGRLRIEPGAVDPRKPHGRPRKELP